jgi:hypothetical protein
MASECVGYLAGMTATSSETSQEASYHVSSELFLTAQAMIGAYNLYSPWYYSFLKDKLSEDEIASGLKTLDDDKLAVLANEMLQYLINSSRLTFDQDKLSLQEEVLYKSLLAIKNSGIYPAMLEVNERIDTRREIASRGLMVTGVLSVAGALFFPGQEYFAVGMLGGMLSFVPGVLLMNGKYYTEIVKENPDKVLEFVLSNGQVPIYMAFNYFKNVDGQWVPQFREFNTMRDQNGQILTDENGEVEVYIPSDAS